MRRLNRHLKNKIEMAIRMENMRHSYYEFRNRFLDRIDGCIGNSFPCYFTCAMCIDVPLKLNHELRFCGISDDAASKFLVHINNFIFDSITVLFSIEKSKLLWLWHLQSSFFNRNFPSEGSNSSDFECANLNLGAKLTEICV